VSKTVEKTQQFSRVIASKENAASLTLRVAPLERGSGNSYTRVVKEHGIPQEIFDAVERGVTSALASGIVLGYPCIDVGVTLINIEYSELTGTEFAFEACASMGFDEACREAGPIQLEPIMAVDITAPHEFVGEVVSLVSQRGGQVLSIDSKLLVDQVRVLSPMAKMFGFMTALRSVSQGRATFSMEFAHFEKIGK
jgi:elongation factor G